MGKRLTIGFVKESFECEGYGCLSNEYSGSKGKLDYICPEGHSGSMSWDAWQQGNRCPTCFIVKNKHTVAFIKSEFEKDGYDCLSKEYVNTHSKVDYICPEGHRGSISWSNWQQGRRCPTCAGVKKYTILFIKAEFKKEGWVCVSTEYINAHSNLDYVCSEGHHGSIAWSDWKKGNRCPVCSGKKKHTIYFIKSEFKKDGYECLSTEYIGAHSKLYYICPKGHRGAIRWSHWQSGHRCKDCAIESITGSKNYNWKGGISKEPYCTDWTKDLKGYVKERDSYKCLNPYCSSSNPNDLNVHHIDYNKKSCGPENLITVCRSCNGRANIDREWHELWYKTILNKRYGYNEQ